MSDLFALKEKFLSDCPSNKVFWIHNGMVIRNIYELVNALEGLSDYSFKYHVNLDKLKNDFAVWIEEVFEDRALAFSLKEVYNKDRYIDIIKQRLIELENL